MLQQLVGHALRRARPDAGQHAQGFDQPLQPFRGGNCASVQNGSLNPAGRPSPAVMPLIFSAMVDSTRRAASLKAAATRSSSISRSSPTSEGSMLMRFTSYLQVICTLTMPAPDWPSTSSVARLSCMRRMFSCIICACFISCPMLPFICLAFSLVLLAQGGIDDLAVEQVDQILDEAVGVDRLRRRRALRLA